MANTLNTVQKQFNNHQSATNKRILKKPYWVPRLFRIRSSDLTRRLRMKELFSNQRGGNSTEHVPLPRRPYFRPPSPNLSLWQQIQKDFAYFPLCHKWYIQANPVPSLMTKEKGLH